MVKPVKKIYVRFFTKSQLFTDGYCGIEGDIIPRQTKIPDLEVKSRKLSDLDFWVPDGAVGFIFFDIITATINDHGQLIELTSGEINQSGRYFFQYENSGCVATREQALSEWERHTYMRRYSRQPAPEKIILYPGPRDGRFLERRYYVCVFDFLETDVLVPLYWVFPSGFIIKAAQKNPKSGVKLGGKY
ncbi:MAG: hypothetical protein UT31_C0027G0004 [Parcubacteria group bacterium GW2011_GWF2_39_13b]|nr:MAG: hypothetical protein UT31_C0027G0004 [Parcubacteria group bacterium GW2011_GWF2_39_13b]